MGWILIISFITLMMVGVPVTISIGAASLMSMIYAGFGGNLMIIEQQILDGVDKPALLAIPFFIMAGNLMNVSGLTDKIFDFATSLVGHFRAGLAQVNVVASLIFAGISGAATADIAGLGIMEVKAMKKRGYPEDFAAALTVATSIVGPIIPPSISLIVYAWLSNTSVARLFLAGIIPGLLVGLGFMIFIRILAIKNDYPCEPRASFKQISQTAVSGITALGAPIIILGAIITGFTTATEAGVLACVYAILNGFILKRLTIKKIWEALTETAIITSVILLIIGFAQIMGWLLAFEMIPQKLADFVFSATSSQSLFLLLVIIFFLIIGCFMEATPSKIILVPLLLPLVDHFGVDRIHFGLIITLSLLIGIATPPMGVGLYTMAGVVKVPFEKIAIAILPLLIPVITVLFLITYIPALTLWLPNLILGP